MEEERVAIIGIFIRDTKAAGRVNDLLHEYSDCIIGRMGIPCREKSINIISIVVSASQGRISALSGQLVKSHLLDQFVTGSTFACAAHTKHMHAEAGGHPGQPEPHMADADDPQGLII